MTLKEELEYAKNELGEEEYTKRLRNVFGHVCLDFVKSIVINLSETCYANCSYCIDKDLRENSIDNESFLRTCEIVLREFPNAQKVSISGGTLNPKDFNRLTKLIRSYLPDASITWNTNGVLVNEDYQEGINEMNHINLHRNSPDDEENRKIFQTTKDIISIEDAKRIMGDRLSIRVTVDKDFDLESYASLGCPLNLNRLLPGDDLSNAKIDEILEKIDSPTEDKRRRNLYLSSTYKNLPIRISVGDKLATHIPGRRPTYLNVAIIHRSGIVCGSWFEDDKKIFNPTMLLDEEYQFESRLDKDSSKREKENKVKIKK